MKKIFLLCLPFLTIILLSCQGTDNDLKPNLKYQKNLSTAKKFFELFLTKYFCNKINFKEFCVVKSIKNIFFPISFFNLSHDSTLIIIFFFIMFLKLFFF